jgi:hypothetical protein
MQDTGFKVWKVGDGSYQEAGKGQLVGAEEGDGDAAFQDGLEQARGVLRGPRRARAKDGARHVSLRLLHAHMASRA